MPPLIPQDKANHIAYGAAIACAATLLHNPMHAAALVVAVAFAKEAADWLLNRRAIAAGLPPPHGVELLDALATMAGGALVLIPQVIA